MIDVSPMIGRCATCLAPIYVTGNTCDCRMTAMEQWRTSGQQIAASMPNGRIDEEKQP